MGGNRRIRPGIVVVVGWLALATTSTSAAAGSSSTERAARVDASYTLVPLPVPAFFESSLAGYAQMRLNEADPPMVAGSVYDGDTGLERPVRWRHDPRVTDRFVMRASILDVHLPDPTEDQAYATGINDTGEVAGTVRHCVDPPSGGTCPGTDYWGFRWSDHGSAKLSPPGTPECARSTCDAFTGGINDDGVVAGQSFGYYQECVSLLWDGQPDILPTPGEGPPYCQGASDVSESGLVAGTVSRVNDDGSSIIAHAAVWAGTDARVLDDPVPGDSVRVDEISDGPSPVVVGVADDREDHVVTWDADGTQHDLGACGGDIAHVGVNRSGQVVGGTCLWNGGTSIQVDSLIADRGDWHVVMLHDINDRGEIAGYARHEDDESGTARPVLLRRTSSELLNLSVANAVGKEGTRSGLRAPVPTGRVVFTIERSGVGVASSVHYATVAGTAKPGKDYTAVEGTLRFTKTERSKTVTVFLQRDARDEPKETFELKLSKPAGARIDDGVGVGTIRDDD